MHIRDGILENEVCWVTGALAVAAVGYSLWRLRRHTDRPSASDVGAVAALVFATQMVNFPLPGLSVSGHLLGGALAAALIGPWAGCVAVALVLVVQALLFGDGGYAALGANVLNMAVAGCWFSALILHSGRKFADTGFWQRSMVVATASIGSVLVAALLFCLQFLPTALAHSLDVTAVVRTMLLFHLAIGVGEAVITLGWLTLLTGNVDSRKLTAANGSRLPAWAGGWALVTACALAPFASGFPDGLEAVGDQFGFNQFARDRAWLLSDYQLPLPLLGDGFAVAAAGLLGTVATLVLACLVMWLCDRGFQRDTSALG